MDRSFEDYPSEVDLLERSVKVCARRKCREPARRTGVRSKPGGVLCRKHHATAMREWRAKRRKAGVVNDPPEATPASSSRGAVSARVQLHRKRKRGQVVPTICAACGIGRQVVGNRIDPDRPDAVVWACRGCRFEIIKGIMERRAAAKREAIERWERQVAANEMTAALARIESLVPAIADALRLAASRGPLGITLSPASPLFQQRLATLIASEMRRTPCTVYRKR